MKMAKQLDVYCLSNAIEQALEDLEACEKSSKFEIDMDHWFKAIVFNGFEATKCSVCFAGSVMAQRSDAGPDAEPSDFTKLERDTLEALDRARSYSFRDMLESFFDEPADEEVAQALYSLKLKPVFYDVNKRTFKSNMRKVIKKLREFEM